MNLATTTAQLILHYKDNLALPDNALRREYDEFIL